MKKNQKIKLFYIHTPKTGGSSVNEYFSRVFPKTHLTHAEAHIKNDIAFDMNAYEFISGHLSYPAVRSLLDDSWIKMVTFREPYSFVISHLCWIRRLADNDEVESYNKHPKNIQKIASKMKTLDFSIASDISRFVDWLNDIEFTYLHNTQTVFISPKKIIERALQNLENIEFVGTLERLDEFLSYMSYELSFKVNLQCAPVANVNTRNYGFNIKDPRIKKALYPLVDKDIILYEAASKRLDKDISSYNGVLFDNNSENISIIKRIKLLKN